MFVIETHVGGPGELIRLRFKWDPDLYPVYQGLDHLSLISEY